MKKMIYLFIVVATTLSLYVSCTLQEPVNKETVLSLSDKEYFGRMMVLGDDFAAGYQNLALTEKHQKYSFPALIARQAGADDFPQAALDLGAINFLQPLMGYPGIGSLSSGGFGSIELLYLDDPATPNTINPDPLIKAVSYEDYPDYDPINMPQISDEIRIYPLPYSNLSMPGIIMEDIVKAKNYLRSASHSRMINIILRNDYIEGEYTALEQAKLVFPSMLLCWIGMNDVLNYAQDILGDQPFPLELPTPAEEFEEYFTFMADSLDSLRARVNTNVFIGNIPDITDMPYFNSVPSVVIDTVTNAPYLDNSGNPIALLGVAEGDLLLRPAIGDMRNGYGIPVGVLNGNGKDIPEEKVLDVSEIALVQQAILDYNTIIDTVCATKGIPVVDMYGLFKELETGIVTPGKRLTNEFIKGGFYSYDGIHPSDLGNAVIANKWIDVINNELPVNVPRVDLNQVLMQEE